MNGKDINIIETVSHSIIDIIETNLGETQTTSMIEGKASDLSVQMVIPPIPWDWKTSSTGVISSAQFDFCDHVPVNCAGSVFESGSESFSMNYMAFLEILSPAFQPLSILTESRRICSYPTGDPSSSFSPVGWVKVLDGAGILRWQPDWKISSVPEAWVQQVISEKNKYGSIDIPVEGLSSPSGEARQHVLGISNEVGGEASSLLPAQGEVRRATIFSEAWDRIAVYAGGWYNSSLMMLGKNGPFLEGYTRNVNNSTPTLTPIFGENCLLSCRISSFIVVFKPGFTLEVNNSFAARYEKQLTEAQELHIGGFVFTTRSSSNGISKLKKKEAGNVVSFTAYTSSQTPLIIGVILEKFN